MNTEITDVAVETTGGWVFYDGECPLCLGAVARFGGLLETHGYRMAALQAPWVARRLGLEPAAPLTEMRLLLADGTVLGGADALMEIARHIWWGWPVFAFAKIPGVLPWLREIYIAVAARRNCFEGKCGIKRKAPRYWLGILPIPGALLWREEMPGWMFMWAMTFAIFFGCKWVTWRKATTRTTPPIWKTLGYFLAWPGMDANAFARETKDEVLRPRLNEWGRAVLKAAGGVGLVYLAAHFNLDANPLLAGWFGIIGIILTLHFGIGELLALAWRSVGVTVTPLMRSPLAAAALAEFWGRRWNTAFSRLAREFVFRPIAKWAGVVWGTLAVFLVSGFVHELVISVPARGGYGWPTAYFAVQGIGMLIERSSVGQALRLRKDLRGRLFTVLVLVAPLSWICPPIFVHNIILPMLRALAGN